MPSNQSPPRAQEALHDSPQPYRIFNIDIFKEAGPPHREHLHPGDSPPSADWIANANPAARKKLFMRDAYTEGCWCNQGS